MNERQAFDVTVAPDRGDAARSIATEQAAWGRAAVPEH
jgi:hypothetical protein